MIVVARVGGAPSPASRGGLGRGKALDLQAPAEHPLPASPCEQGEELSGQRRSSLGKPKATPPPFPVRVVQHKAPGGDLLRVAPCDRHSNIAPDVRNATKTKAFPVKGRPSWIKPLAVTCCGSRPMGATATASPDVRNATKTKAFPVKGRPSWIKPLAVTYSCMAKPHYHRRMRVSLLSSGWDQVVPRRYGRQGRGGSSALSAGSTFF